MCTSKCFLEIWCATEKRGGIHLKTNQKKKPQEKTNTHSCALYPSAPHPQIHPLLTHPPLHPLHPARRLCLRYSFCLTHTHRRERRTVMHSCTCALSHSLYTHAPTHGQDSYKTETVYTGVCILIYTFPSLTFHVSSGGRLLVGRPGTTTPLQVCDKVLASGRRGGRLCCIHHTGLTYHPLLLGKFKYWNI